MSMLSWLVALVSLVEPCRGVAGDAPPPDLELASLAVTDRIVWGIIGPSPRVWLAASYDRVERGFRAVRRREGPAGSEVWVADLEPEQFRALLELAVASGLPALPLENPPGCMDVYGCVRQIRLAYGKVRWANGAQGGCVGAQSSVLPSEEQSRRFQDIVTRLEKAIDALPLRPGSEEDQQRIPFLPDLRALDSYQRVMEHVLADPVRHRLDLERVRAGGERVGFCSRGREPVEYGNDVEFEVEPSGAVQRTASSQHSAFDPFVPIETGMTLEEVEARLGPPDERDGRKDGSLVLTYRQLPPGTRPGFHRRSRLRFEDGRLSAP